jgi:ATPase subunit of ABC transporter with duplicated ATPase domains
MAAFAGLGDLGDVSTSSSSSREPPKSTTKPELATEPVMDATSPTGSLGTIDMFINQDAPTRSQRGRTFEDDEEDEWDEDEELDEDDVMRKRRRGDADLIAWELQGTTTEGEITVGLRDVSIRLGGRQVLQDASWKVTSGDKLALVGANGCGKTTQLKILTGEYTPDEGSIFMSQPNIKMSTLSQGFVDELDLERTLREELLSAVPKEREILRDYEAVKAKLEDMDPNSPEATPLLDDLGRLSDLAEQYKVYELDQRLAWIAENVGFFEKDLEQKVGLFSGGWKVRIGLSKIFMTAPDVLLLDEPTNHLDLESVEWLESFMMAQDLPLVVVSHDREFMDRICNVVVDTIEGMTYTYPGNYSNYILQRDLKMRKWTEAYRRQCKVEQETIKYIKLNKNKQAMAQAVKRRREQLEDMRKSKDWLDPPPRYFKRIKFDFPEPPLEMRGSRNKAMCMAYMNSVTHGYGDGEDATLFDNIRLDINYGEKIGIVGRNGAGKSTLLRLLMGREEPSGGGSIMPGQVPDNCYFTQHQADLLPLGSTAFEAVDEANQLGLSQQKLVEMMEKFRFKGNRLDMKVSACSGGEKARLALVRMMLTPSKMLVLDEPTNHLDVVMKETLEYSLREFPGAVVVVSHDRFFLSQVCRKIYAVQDQTVDVYDGDFRYYMDSDHEMRKKVEARYSASVGGIGAVPMTEEEEKLANKTINFKGNDRGKWLKKEKERKKKLAAMSRGRA